MNFETLKNKFSNINNLNPYVIKYSTYVISAIFSVLFLQSQGSNLFAKCLLAILAMVQDLAKYTLPPIAVVGICMGKKIHWSLRLIALIMAVACFYYSIMASKGFQLIEFSKINNTTYKSSDEYKKYSEDKSRIESQIALKQKQLTISLETSKSAVETDKTLGAQNASLIAQYSKDIKSWQSQINEKNYELQECINKEAKGKSMTNTKARLYSEISQLKQNIKDATTSRDKLTNINATATTNATITKLNNDIDFLNTELINLQLPQSTIQQNKKLGYEILFNSQKAFDTFVLCFYILIELIGVYFSIMIEIRKKDIGIGPDPKRKKPITDDEKPKKEYEPAPQLNSTTRPTLVYKNNFSAPPKTNRYEIVKGISNGKVMEYVNQMYKTAKEKDGLLLSDGYKKIGTAIGIKENDARKISNWLETSNVIEINKTLRKSVINKSKNEISMII